MKLKNLIKNYSPYLNHIETIFKSNFYEKHLNHLEYLE